MSRAKARPSVELIRNDAGEVVSACLRLQDGKAAGAIQPNPDVPVFFMLDAARQLVAITFHQPVSGVALLDVLDVMIEDHEGRPVAMDRVPRYRFKTAAHTLAVVHRARHELRDAFTHLASQA